MHSRITTETVKLWRPSQGPLQILKSQVYWKPAHTRALFVVCCHHGLCGSAAAHTAKLASNIINRHPKLPGRDPGSPKRRYTSRPAIQSLQKEQWELKPLHGSGSVSAWNAGSHGKQSRARGPGAWTALCPLVPHHKQDFREIKISGKSLRYTTPVTVLQHTALPLVSVWLTNTASKGFKNRLSLMCVPMN